MAAPIQIIILMGVSGCGKTTMGKLLADNLGWRFEDGDDYHSAANKEKMHSGEPLSDEDRLPWLQTLAEHVALWRQENKPTVLACSALKAGYRDILTGGSEAVVVVFLKADFDVIAGRLNARTGHFMNKDLLKSQFETLEVPDANIATVDASQTPQQIIEQTRQALGL